jgi:hypothetical protein
MGKPLENHGKTLGNPEENRWNMLDFSQETFIVISWDAF